MKLDRTQTYGQIWGHPSAMYEQGGNLFDGAGDPIDQKKRGKSKSKEPEVYDEESQTLEKSKAFLRKLLADSEMSKTNIYREVDQSGQDWESVKNAAPLVGVTVYRKGTVEMWKLTEA